MTWRSRRFESDDDESQSAVGNGAVALFDNVLAVGTSPDDVKAVIDVVQGRAESAETNERLQEFRALQEEDFLMWGYADLAPVWDLAEEGFATTIGGSGGSESTEGSIPPPVEPDPTPEPAPTQEADEGFAITSFDARYRSTRANCW